MLEETGIQYTIRKDDFLTLPLFETVFKKNQESIQKLLLTACEKFK